MEIIDPYLSPSSYKKIINRYGGAYGIWESIKIGGIGSPKVVYRTGIEAFNEIKDGLGNEIPFVNFELLKNGLILRINKKQKLGVGLIHFEELLSIRLSAFRILLKYNHRSDKLVHAGKLEIELHHPKILHFEIPVKEFQALHKYFKKEPFQPFFHFEKSDAPPIIDRNAKILDLLSGL